jgi:hypothetical protein
MSRYNILEARIEYRNKRLHRVTVLVEMSQGDIRAIYATDTFTAGYECLSPDEPVTNELLQRVAGYGRQAPIADHGKLFPGWKKHLKG